MGDNLNKINSNTLHLLSKPDINWQKAAEIDKKFNDDLLISAANTLKDIIEGKGIPGLVWEE